MNIPREKIIEAMGLVRKAMGLVEQVTQIAQPVPESLVGIHPNLRAALDSLCLVAHDLQESEVVK